jgi:hypothetical protein
VLRQAIEKQLDRIEHARRFTRAVSVGNPREFLQAEKEDQEMAEACKRLIKRCCGTRLRDFLAAHQLAGRV